MLTIHLQQLHFKAYHGLYPQEKILGNNYIVNVDVSYLPQQKIVKHITQTINYVDLYEIIKNRMSIATPLLETVAMEISQQIFDTFLPVQQVNITIQKTNPPIQSFIGNVAVTYHKKR